MDICIEALGYSTSKLKDRKRLRYFLTTALIGSSLILVPNVARAATHTLDDPQNAPQSVTTDADPEVTVNTTGDFSVSSTVAGSSALDIEGDGKITYNDLGNNNNISSTLDNGLSVLSWADSGATLGSVTIDTGGVIYGGGQYGVEAQNNGAGDINITTRGTVTGYLNSGIWTAHSDTNTTTGTIIINALGDVNGDNMQGGNNGPQDGLGYGITATNHNSGLSDATTAINIYTEGNVEGGSSGIYAWAVSGSVNIETNGTVTGGLTGTGIDARSQGRGAVDITANDDVTAGGYAAINVEAPNWGAGNGDYNGSVTIRADGDVTNTGTGYGIRVYNEHNASTAAVPGSSFTTITTTGMVQGGAAAGISVWNANETGQTDVNVTSSGGVAGGSYGILVKNDGQLSSHTTINTVGGAVTGGVSDGIHASNTSGLDTGNIDITTAVVTGGRHGIFVQNSGTGDVNITANGNVAGGASGGEQDGIYAQSSGNVNIHALRNVSAEDYGIHVDTENNANNATRSGNVTVDGTVSGYYSGIYQWGFTAQNTTINVGSVVKSVNFGGVDWAPDVASTKDAIVIDGYHDTDGTGFADQITNHGTVIGNIISVDEGIDTITNTGIWNNAGGTSNLTAGDDTFNNETGASYLAANQTGSVNTYLLNTETVNNNGGEIVMQNMDSRIGGTAAFEHDITTFSESTFNTGGRLLVDTSLTTGLSDELHVGTVSTGGGATLVNVSMVDALGKPTTPFNGGNGILVVDSTDGSSTDAFTLQNQLTGGIYKYELNLVNDQDWYLQSATRAEAAAAGALSVLGSRSALSSLSNLHDRQRDVETLSNDSESRKGVWGRVFGQSNDFESAGSGFDSDLWGVQAGLDFLAKGDYDGKRKYAGLYVAYADSNGNATQEGQKVGKLDMNTTSLGLYYTKYAASHWYLDLVAQYSRLGGVHLKTATDDVSPSGNSYALSLEVGQQFNPQGSVIGEVQAQLIDQYTDMDNVSLSDGTRLGLSSMNAVTGRFGVRFYGNPREEGKSLLPWVRANVWHTFSGDSTVSSMGNSLRTPMGGTSGELELGFSKGHAKSGGWGFYGSAGYLFDLGGAEYSGWKGTLGMRKGW